MPLQKPDTPTLILGIVGGVAVLAAAGLAWWLYTTSPNAQHIVHEAAQQTPFAAAEAPTDSDIYATTEPTAPAIELTKAEKAHMAGVPENPTKNPNAPTLEVTEIPRYIKNAVAEPVAPKGEPRIAIIIDDVGVNNPLSHKADEMLPPEVTFSFLPYGNSTLELAKKAKKEGREVMIHMPMEPMPRLEEPPIDPGPNALYINLDDAEIAKRIAINLKDLKDMAVGVNNHMGSRFTSYEHGMEEALKAFNQEGLFFLDSLTTNKSAVKAAHDNVAPDMPLLKRDVFLDHYSTKESLYKALERLEVKARKNGQAIAIGHPHTRTLEVLQDWLPTLSFKGIYLVPVSHLLPNMERAFEPSNPQLPEGKSQAEVLKTLQQQQAAQPAHDTADEDEEMEEFQPTDETEPAHVTNPNDPTSPNTRLY